MDWCPTLWILPYFTLTFDSSPIKGEGDMVGCVGLLLPVPHAALWILP